MRPPQEDHVLPVAGLVTALSVLLAEALSILAIQGPGTTIVQDSRAYRTESRRKISSRVGAGMRFDFDVDVYEGFVVVFSRATAPFDPARSQFA